jgi:hypothetical protein
MTWKTRMGGFLTKSDHMFLINKMKTNRNHNPTIVHEVQSDFVCLKENFGINSKMFRSDASIKRVGISEDALNGVEINGGNEFECEYDKWSPNESMK